MKDKDVITLVLLGMLCVILLWGMLLADSAGVKREPTNKDKFCSCVIQVDSVPEPKDIVEKA